MTLIESGPIQHEFRTRTPDNREYRIDASRGVNDRDLALELLFPRHEILETTKSILDETGFASKALGRRWALLVTNGDSPESDIAESVLTTVFSDERFGEHPASVAEAYGYYKPASIFISVIDTEHSDGPTPVSALQIVKDSVLGCKSINTLADSDPNHNPWYHDLSQVIGEWGKGDEARVVRIISHLYDVEPGESWSIESMAALPEYRGKHGLVGEASFPLYAICLQMSNRANIRSWLSIQDIKPMQQMQDIFAKPWSTLSLPPRIYDGSLTIPTVIHDMQEAQNNLRLNDPNMGELLIDGEGMSSHYVMPEELFGSKHLDTLAKT